MFLHVEIGKSNSSSTLGEHYLLEEAPPITTNDRLATMQERMGHANPN